MRTASPPNPPPAPWAGGEIPAAAPRSKASASTRGGAEPALPLPASSCSFLLLLPPSLSTPGVVLLFGSRRGYSEAPQRRKERERERERRDVRGAAAAAAASATTLPGAHGPRELQEGWRAPSRITHGEPQKTCSKPVAAKVTDSCQQICQCRPPPLPPPPPPPPPPRLLGVPSPTVPVCPAPESWWPGPVIIIAACCTTPVFLFLVFIICYKAIKSTPPVSAGDTFQDPPWIPETVDNSETYILTIIELEACRKIAVENVENPTNTPGREYFLELGIHENSYMSDGEIMDAEVLFHAFAGHHKVTFI
ncbi:proline-rich membrane anchor 1 isoform X2 [Anolis carolinensis]|uniref:proline-rich membrane anchor 1 isoform X2 n=1 Tax=Anolis carolinensis TaxID=28377 RepID=UPI00046276BF